MTSEVAPPGAPLQREVRRATDIIRLLALYRPLLDADVIVSRPHVSRPRCPPR